MRRRLILINSVFIILTMLASLIYNVITFSNMNIESTKSELSNYLAITTKYYDSTNSIDTIHLFDNANKTIRVTIIDLDGNVIADSSTDEIATNHLYRDEIKNLNTFVERKSSTLGVNMLYLATSDDGVYIRLAIEVSSINSYVVTYVLTDGLTSLIILLISIVLLIFIIRKYLSPLSEATMELEKITNSGNTKESDSLEVLVTSIEKASEKLKEHMQLLTLEKEKVLYIINNISQGLIIIDSAMNINLINNYALKALDLKLENVIDKNYIYCFRSEDINTCIKNITQDGKGQIIEFNQNGVTYQVSINNFDDKIAVLLTDITKLKNLDITKREFFQNASHELKSPLTSIIGYQQMIKEGILTDPDEIMDATSKTITEANRMNDIIIDMLDLSKLESETKHPSELIDLDLVIEEALLSLENKAKEKNIIITKAISNCKIYSSKDHIYTLIKNIIENGIKYNKYSGSLNIELKDNILTVTDSGIGIEKKNLSRIFERFYRVDKAKSKALGSSGLGLAIVKHICKMYNYEISVDSTYGVGTTFAIIFK